MSSDLKLDVKIPSIKNLMVVVLYLLVRCVMIRPSERARNKEAFDEESPTGPNRVRLDHSNC